jgi:hypothetical protein
MEETVHEIKNFAPSIPLYTFFFHDQNKKEHMANSEVHHSDIRQHLNLHQPLPNLTVNFCHYER